MHNLFRAENPSIHAGEEANLEARKREPRPSGRGNLLDKNSFLILIIFLAFILRFYQLGNFPPSLFIDEISNGYNAYSILKTARDEYGNLLPLVIRSFGDYNPALSVYTLIPAIAAFGLNETGVRFPSAVFGTLTVLLTYFLALKISSSQKIARVSSLLLAIAPWHLQFSRYDHEANFLVFFCVLGFTIFLYSKNRFIPSEKTLAFMPGMRVNPRSEEERATAFRPWESIWLTIATITFGLALNAYHAAKIWIPLFLAALIVLYWREIINIGKRKLFLLGVIFSIFTLPILLNFKSSLIRSQSVGILNQKAFVQTFTSGYFSHFSPNFLFISGDSIGRHSVQGMGELYVFELPLLVIGLVFLIHSKKEKGEKFLLIWLLLAPIPASLASPTPHALRSLTFIPTFWIISAYGLKMIMSLKKINLKYFFLVCILLIFTYNVTTYLHLYYVHYPKIKALDWTYGYKQVFEFIQGKQDYKTIAISDYYGWPYIATLFYSKFDPKQYQLQPDGKLGFSKYEFFKESWQKSKTGKALVITPAWQGHPPKVLQEIYFPNGDLAFRVSEEE